MFVVFLDFQSILDNRNVTVALGFVSWEAKQLETWQNISNFEIALALWSSSLHWHFACDRGQPFTPLLSPDSTRTKFFSRPSNCNNRERKLISQGEQVKSHQALCPCISQSAFARRVPPDSIETQTANKISHRFIWIARAMTQCGHKTQQHTGNGTIEFCSVLEPNFRKLVLFKQKLKQRCAESVAPRPPPVVSNQNSAVSAGHVGRGGSVAQWQGWPDMNP